MDEPQHGIFSNLEYRATFTQSHDFRYLLVHKCTSFQFIFRFASVQIGPDRFVLTRKPYYFVYVIFLR
jgi:hypothetical protein